MDIDGDRNADQIGIVAKHATSGGTITVRVRTARRTMQTTSSGVWWALNPWFGAAPIDGRAGAEIVVGDASGAHYEQFRVITYRQGRLVTLAAPPSLPNGPWRWGIDGSYSSNIGISRSVSSKGVVTLTTKTAARNQPSGRGHTGETAVYRWKSTKWVKVSRKTVHYASDGPAQAICGWHVKGLRLYG